MKSILRKISDFFFGLRLFRSISFCRAHIKTVGIMILFDGLFVLSIASVSGIAGFLSGAIIPRQTLGFALMMLTLTFLYRLLQLGIYSFFKLAILDTIFLRGKTQISLGFFLRFFWLNILFSLIILTALFIGGFLIIHAKQSVQGVFGVVAAVVLGLAGYIFLNMMHVSFAKKNSVLHALGSAMRFLFRKNGYVILLQGILLLGIIFLPLGYLFNFFPNLGGGLLIVMGVFTYLMHVVIRVGFYLDVLL